MFVEMERVPKMFAFGYKTQKTDGTVIYVWRLKGSFTVPEQTSATKDDGTDANGQTLTYTGISTTHAFNKTGASAKSFNIDTSNNPLGITSDEFFATVQTPDTIGETVAVTGVTVTPDTASVTVNSTTTLTATVAPTNASNKAVTWESSDNEVATVVNGVVSGVSAGTATITVTTVDGNFTDTAAITVTSE
ncbi:MAG: Ig domain-containing protein [Firmicutes bacterium]|nr:Ig domain-containing protein [Bacillota bacterium]